MKIYTRTGDEGATSLFGGQRVGKDSLRIEACGTVDECNAALGLAVAVGVPAPAKDWLEHIQRVLFDVGADIADPRDLGTIESKRKPLSHEQTVWLEEKIDHLDAELEPLRRFILPGGSEAAATLHLARAICRRAERMVVRLGREEALHPELARYLNRLSDFLFTLARWINHKEGAKEPQVEF